MTQKQFQMSKSKPIKNKQIQIKQKSEGSIKYKPKSKQSPVETMDTSITKELQNFSKLDTQTQKSKSVILESPAKRNINKTRKRPTIWTKFPADGETATKVQKSKPASVYKPGVSYSDALFSAGPCSTVHVKNVPTKMMKSNPEGPSVATNEIFPTLDQKNCGIPKTKLKKVKQSEKSTEVDENKFKIEAVEEEIELAEICKTKTDEIICKIETVEEELKKSEIWVSEVKTSETFKIEPLPENFESEFLQKEKITNKLELPSFINAPSSSDENANVTEPSESDSESNILEIATLSQLSFKSSEINEKKISIYNIPDQLSRIPKKDEKADYTFFGIPKWNFFNPYTGPEILPRHTRHFTDESYLYAEDLAMLAIKLAKIK